jgi:hypothetical protein
MEGVMTRTIRSAVLAATVALALAAPALAAPPGYDANPGREQAGEAGAQCGSGAGSGGFGAFGKDNNFAGGANGPATGAANSAICGNREAVL